MSTATNQEQTMTGNQLLIEEYLNRLQEAARGLSPDVAADLVADIRDHLAQAEVEAAGSEAALRNAIDRLGSPEALVAEVAESAPETTVAGPAGEVGSSGGDTHRLETASLGLMVAGAVLAASLVGIPISIPVSILGVALMLFSRRWTGADKFVGGVAFGLLTWPLAIGMGAMTFSAYETCSAELVEGGRKLNEHCTSHPGLIPTWVGWAFVGIVVIFWIYAALRLYRRVSR